MALARGSSLSLVTLFPWSSLSEFQVGHWGWSAWDSGRCPHGWGGTGWDLTISKILFNPNHPMVPWFLPTPCSLHRNLLAEVTGTFVPLAKLLKCCLKFACICKHLHCPAVCVSVFMCVQVGLKREGSLVLERQNGKSGRNGKGCSPSCPKQRLLKRFS